VAIEISAALCRRFEGLFLQPYLCPAGVPSIGYGTTHYADGRAVTLKDPAITKAQAERAAGAANP
jgi:lysozyme